MTHVLHLNTFDIKGGAARAAYRLHWGLRTIGVDSYMLVQRKKSSDPTVLGPHSTIGRGTGYLRELIDLLPLKFYRPPADVHLQWGLGWFPWRVAGKVRKQDPNIIHLHWVGGGFLPIAEMAKFDRPVVWTLHDMWAFTGGCHYAGDCTRYMKACGACPGLDSKKETDPTRKNWQKKKKAYMGMNLTVVTPSRWLAQCAGQSPLLKDCRIEVIPNGLDLDVFKPREKQALREQLSLPRDKKLVLFGAVSSTSDRRKGFHLLQPALRFLSGNRMAERTELLVFGASEPENPPDFGLPTRYLGSVPDEQDLALLYGASDVFVAPSVQDNLPNIVVEALACGTPCVAFDIGGMPDMIEHKQNGYLARPFETKDLAKGIEWVLHGKNKSKKRSDTKQNLQNHTVLSQKARKKAEETFELTHAASRYRDLYKELIDAG